MKQLLLWLCFLATLSGAVCAQKTTTSAPAIVRLEIVSRAPVLDGPKARQRLLVNGIRQDGSVVDVTETAQFVSSDAKTTRVEESVAFPVADGTATITAKVNRFTATTTVVIRNTHKPFRWSFENHVQSVLSRQGCNMGICHGGQSGKGGFKLSLRAYDDAADYERLRHEGRGRRLNLLAPDASLLLRKPSLGVAHVGGMRLPKSSWDYGVLRDWISAGAYGPKNGTPQLVRLDVTPNERTLSPNATQRLLVTARFSDGHTEDVTHWAKFSSNEETLARVTEAGRVTMRAHGEAVINVWYLGKVTFARFIAPFPNRIDLAKYKKVPRSTFLDDHINHKLAQLQLWPSELCTDSEFIRRAFLDTIGVLPAPEETRAFVADRAPDKRNRLIEALLERPEFVDRWTTVWGDLLRVNRDLLGDKGMWNLYLYLRQSVAQNKPWNRLVRELVTANGSPSESGPANFYRLGSRPEEFAETVSQAFLGIRVQCAHCHNHPHEKWTQSDYYRMANLFARVGKKGEGDTQAIFTASEGDVDHPRLRRPLPPAAFDGPTLALDSPRDRREFLADWLAAPDNPFVARSVVNRVWKRFMGRGLVEPVDDMRLTNPASNEPLLAALTKDFVAHNFDLKHLMRTILRSRAYQLSARPNATNRADDRFYSRCLPRRLTAEQMLDALCQVTGQPEKFPGLPSGTKASALPDTRIASSFLDSFGRPARQVTCECERNTEPSVAQALTFINGTTLNAKISASGGVLDRLLDSGKTDAAILTELYLSALSRPPSDAEKTVFSTALTAALPTALAPKSADGKAQPPDTRAVRFQVFGDLLWALLSGPEFQFNH
jgi:hypothetical protein